MKLITVSLLLAVVCCTAFPNSQYPEEEEDYAPEEGFVETEAQAKHGLGEHPVCAKACGSLPAPFSEHKDACLKWCEKLEPPLNVVEMLAKAARTTEEKVEKVFSFIAREAIKGGGKFPEEKKIADYAIEELRIDAEGFANAVNMVKIHLMEVQSKDKERDHPVCAKTCGSLPKKFQKHARECVEWCEDLEPPLNVVKVLAEIAHTPEENIEKIFSFFFEKAIEAGGKFPDEAKVAQFAIGKLEIDPARFRAAAQLVKEHIKEVHSK